MAQKPPKKNAQQRVEAKGSGTARLFRVAAGSTDPCKGSDFPCHPVARAFETVMAIHASDTGDFPPVPVVPGLSKPTERKVKRYGWVPDLPDARDHMYAAPMFLSLPTVWDLRDHDTFPPVYNQGDLGSCTANALAAAIQFERIRQRLPAADQIPSRLFIYYNERVIEGSITADNGAQLRDGIKTTVHTGSCFEGNSPGEWPYDVLKFATPPPPECYTMALKDRVLGYSRLSQTIDQMRGCLASGYPFVFGFTAYESLEGPEAAAGVVPLPSPHEKAIGGHAVMAVGYNDSTQQFIIRNSWGSGWGKGGYCTMPYTYLTNENLASDFWTIRLVSASLTQASLQP